MFINSRQVERETTVKHCITVTYIINRRTKETQEPLKLYFNSEIEADNIIGWFTNRDTDCLFIEYDLDPISEQFNERMMLDRKTILKITKESLWKYHFLNFYY